MHKTRLSWLLTLWRHSALCPAIPPRLLWRRATLILLAATWPTQAATLRAYNELVRPVVRLSDLFEGIDAGQDRPLGPSPAPGDRFIVEAPQLAAIARDFNVAWRPASGSERTVLERAGTPLPLAPVLEALRAGLSAAGAPPDADIDLPGYDPPIIPANTTPRPATAHVNYDPTTGAFTAVLAISLADMPPMHARLTGTVLPMVNATILTRHLRPNAIITDSDVKPARIRAALLRGNPPLPLAAAIGQALRHDEPAGQPLSPADVTRPRLVTRGETVRVTLNAGPIALTAQGVAMEDGGLADRIRVQNPASRAVFIAEITAAGEARVTPGAAPLIAAAQ
jgi:flagella basal body P-ring formation protein FlgA